MKKTIWSVLFVLSKGAQNNLLLIMRFFKTTNILLFLSLFTSAYGQSDSTRKNAFSVVAVGETMGLSVQYERQILQKKYFSTYLGIGAGYTFLIDQGICIPSNLGCSFGKKKHFGFIELHALNFFIKSPYPKTKSERVAFKQDHPDNLTDKYRAPYNLWPGLSIGYKLILKRGFLLKVGVSGFIYKENQFISNVTILGIPKISLGYAF